MVETVEQRLEHFVPTFEQLISLNIFSRCEVKAIIERRRAFEHSLHSKNARLDAYLKYIEYESAVLQLTEQRKAERSIDSSARLLSDRDWPRHIRSIFIRATRHFSTDLSIWNLYLDFCERTHAVKALDRAFAECVRLHGSHPEVWIRAARWQMLDNSNVELAKSYLEHAIERIPGSVALYAAYAETLLYLGRQIESRRELHGIERPSDFAKAPIAVFDRGLRACADRGELFGRFVDLFEKYEVDTAALREMGIASGDSGILAAIARADGDPAGRFRAFLRETPSRGLQIAFADWLCAQKRGGELAQLLDGIESLSPEECERYAGALIDGGQLEAAEELLDGELETKQQQALRLRLYSAQFPDCDGFVRAAGPLVRRFATAELSSDFLLFVAQKIEDFEKWLETVKQRVPFVTADVVGSALQVSLLKFGPESADRMLEAVLPLVVPTPAFVGAAIEVVRAQPVVDAARERSLHELNVAKWGGSNTQAWLNYAQFEYQQRQLKKMEMVRWKALRTLADGAEFAKEYARRFCQKS
jgi:U3 small nucleolar RNA-associated protein 6